MLVGVAINTIVPEKAFSYSSSVATLCVWNWGVIVACHFVYRRRVERGEAPASSFKLPLATPLCWATLAFLAAVTVLLAFDEGQRIALYALPIWVAVLLAGYYLSARRTPPTHPQTSGSALHPDNGHAALHP
ncbi:D-serine/D-alanine/glycine transporter [Rhodococcus wratislaviensis]|uniref:D-serine/D-alanine/glycine transporter n=1 Tax=Rhodococcus wratislaviensis TaxID=44752 RepID=A0A402C2W4_RHOWR|nr:hypothetical protein [Rhodococcus wratislaviensis]GCE37931.1 D-serine/D-alanine/glycine transporter [Rhodococcus wratislaviensis]